MEKTIGIIETIGYTAAIKAADMMVKMAYVTVISMDFIGAGIVTTVIEGDIESVKTALQVGEEAIGSTGSLVSVHSIGKPIQGTVQHLCKMYTEDSSIGMQNGDDVEDGI